jgi:hypothetical protein
MSKCKRKREGTCLPHDSIPTRSISKTKGGGFAATFLQGQLKEDLMQFILEGVDFMSLSEGDLKKSSVFNLFVYYADPQPARK